MNDLLEIKKIVNNYISSKKINTNKLFKDYDLEDENTDLAYYDVFPGVILSLFNFNNEVSMEKEIEETNILEINYCIKGRFECELNNNTVVYVGEGDLSMNYIGHLSVESSFPLKLYEGVSFYINVDKFKKELHETLKMFSIDMSMIDEKFKLENECYVCKAIPRIKNIFTDIYESKNKIDIQYIRIKCIELLHSLKLLSNEPRYCERYYSKNQVNKIKHIRNHMVEHDDRRFSLEKLTKEHEISLTLFKNGFKKIYGDTPYAYIRKYKMNKATILLSNSKDININDIAILLGYKNASKFSKAFKDVIGITPREYKMKN